jgi:hypothetical protein
LQELWRGDRKGLTEEDHVHGKLQLHSLRLRVAASILKVDIGLDMNLWPNIDLNFKLIIRVNFEGLAVLVPDWDELKFLGEDDTINLVGWALVS